MTLLKMTYPTRKVPMPALPAGGASTHLDGEVEHQAVGVGLSQLVEEVPPGGVGDHLLQPGRRLTEARDGTGLAPSTPSESWG